MYLDNASQWQAIKKSVHDGIASLFPLSANTNMLTLDGVEVREPKTSSVKGQRDALLKGESMCAAVYCSFSLTDKHGRTLDRDKIKVLDLPILTQRGTFVVKGKDYSVFNQVRLKPGVYVRRAAESNAVSARFNLGKGLGFRINLDPATSVFTIQFDASKANAGGQSKIPLYSLLHSIGVSDQALAASWGDAVLEANRGKVKDHMTEDIKKIVNLCVYSKERTGNDAADLLNYFDKTILSGETTKVTLGNAYGKVSAGAMIDACKKLVRVYTNKEDEDDMDSLLFKEVLGAEDHIMLRIAKGAKIANGPLFKIRRKLDTAKHVRDCVPNSFLSKIIESFFTSSSLSSPQSEINPIEILETGSKVTAMGEGGIQSEHGVPMSARNLHPSHFGYIDPVRTTESLRVGVDNRLTHGAVVKGRNIYSKFVDKNGKEVMLKPLDLVGKTIGFPDQSTPIVKAMRGGEIVSVPRTEVNYWMDKPRDMFALTPNLVPFLHNDQGNRITMSSRFLTQAVPLVHREAPLVQVQGETGRSFERELATDKFSPTAPEDGIVRAITDDYIQINNTKVDIYTHFPLNYKCQINMYPKVKIGDHVKKGQLLADSNFSKDGTLALGTNLRTAYVSYKGYNHEDGIVISSSAAKKLTSEHMYTKELELGPDLFIDKHKFAMSFPSKVTAAQLDKLDDIGVAKIGEIINKDDFVICALATRHLTEADIMLKRLKLGIATQYKNASVMWDHDRPGKVTDVVRTNKIIKVVLTTEDETQVGDKLCYSADTEVLTRRGWLNFKDVNLTDEICCLDPETDNIVYDHPTEVYSWDHKGSMYHIKNIAIDQLVTLDHKMYVKLRDSDHYSLKPARDIIGKRVRYKRNGINTSTGIGNIVVPELGDIPEKVIDATHFSRLLGYYLSEGSTYARPGGNYVINISQSKSANPDTYDDIVNTIRSAGLNPIPGEEYIRIYSKQLHLYFKQFGKAFEKYIPRDILNNVDTNQAKALLGTLMAGDGNWSKTGTGEYTTTSKRLADDVQELALKCGYCGVVKPVKQIGTIKIMGKECTCRDIHRVSIILKKFNPQVNHGHTKNQNAQVEELVDYDGKVYCCTVPTHVLYVRRNGKPCWSGNSNRHGGKGVVTLILPDNEMPYTADGKPLEQLLNPAGVISRVNPGQLYETMAGKKAEIEGKPYIVRNFDKADSSVKVLNELKSIGVKPEELVLDPETKKPLGHVFTGQQYTLKLHKQTEGNYSARFTGPYDANLQPTKGGDKGGKAVGTQDFYAFLGHNARNALKEVATYKGEQNDEFWDAIRLGRPIPPAKTPFVFNKLKAMMGATGINVVEGLNKDKEKELAISPLTDKDIISRSSGKVQNPLMLKGSVDDMIPETGGLFDAETTGGLHGNKWTHIDLAEPITHPLFLKQVKTITGVDPETISGAEMKKVLKGINIDARLKELTTELGNVKGAQRDKVLKELRILAGLKRSNTRPEDLVLTKFPVMPPVYRPIYPAPGGGSPMIADINNLYKDLMVSNEAMNDIKHFPDEHKTELRKALNAAAGAVIGVCDPVNEKSKKQELKGGLKQITGNTAKEGFFHRKLLYRPQDLTGRGTIIPDPKLHVDECKIPIDMAHEVYRPFIVRRLVQMGFTPAKALKDAIDRTDVAKQILKEEMDKRPVMINRAPTLHKYNLLALKPKAVEGKSIFIPPLIIKGFAADFDGDSVAGDTWVVVEDYDGSIGLKQIKEV